MKVKIHHLHNHLKYIVYKGAKLPLELVGLDVKLGKLLADCEQCHKEFTLSELNPGGYCADCLYDNEKFEHA